MLQTMLILSESSLPIRIEALPLLERQSAAGLEMQR